MPDHDDEQLEPDLVDDDTVPENQEEGFFDKLRGGGVGTEDPMIVGDAGPTDIPPGTDGDGAGILVTTDAPVDHLEV